MKIVITGVTRGLGRAMAEWYIAHGHQVAGCGRSGQEIFDLRFEHPAPHEFSPLDVTNAVKVAIWAERVLGVFQGPPDLLINNAAVMNDPAPLWEVPGEKFAQLMQINLVGVHNVIRSFVPAMVEQARACLNRPQMLLPLLPENQRLAMEDRIKPKQGVIVNFSSGWGRSVAPEVAPYCASKWAIEGLTKALAEELPAGMAAIPLNPGVIDTAMLRQCWADGASSYPSAAEWAKRAAPYILELGPRHNGQSLTVE